MKGILALVVLIMWIVGIIILISNFIGVFSVQNNLIGFGLVCGAAILGAIVKAFGDDNDSESK